MAGKKTRTICNKCGKSFILKPNMIKDNTIAVNVIRIDFSCPKCGATYLIGYKNAEIIENIKKIEQIRYKIHETYKFEPMELDKELSIIAELKGRNLQINEILKAIYGRT